ncbi:MAG: hypothetical protein LBR31_06580 [Desulfovibrio sp.]|nr:hypothetical protein [Desulfovibrio sp.]
MPAGARPAYMGIHGGTMPVSLLVAADGASLLGFVGRTGNDFLDMLRSLKLPFFPNLTLPGNTREQEERKTGAQSGSSDKISDIPDKGALPAANGLYAVGNSMTSLPVIHVNGGFDALPFALEQLLPFGFSDKPLVIEGDIPQPAKSAPARRYRLVFDPHYLQPKSR